eukprot:198110-Pleurochrysis_carterae.AAC.2
MGTGAVCAAGHVARGSCASKRGVATCCARPPGRRRCAPRRARAGRGESAACTQQYAAAPKLQKRRACMHTERHFATGAERCATRRVTCVTARSRPWMEESSHGTHSRPASRPTQRLLPYVLGGTLSAEPSSVAPSTASSPSMSTAPSAAGFRAPCRCAPAGVAAAPMSGRAPGVTGGTLPRDRFPELVDAPSPSKSSSPFAPNAPISAALRVPPTCAPERAPPPDAVAGVRQGVDAAEGRQMYLSNSPALIPRLARTSLRGSTAGVVRVLTSVSLSAALSAALSAGL